MVNYEEKIIYTEVYKVIKRLKKEDYNKIPQEYIKFFEDNISEECEFEYNPFIPLNEQNISSAAKAILFGLYMNYATTVSQKEKLLKYKYRYNTMNTLKKNDELKEKYNQDNVFKKCNVNTRIPNNKEVAMIEVKSKKWYKKIFLFFKDLIIRK